MTDKRFNGLSILFVITLIVLAILGESFKSASLLFNVLLAVIGILAGYLTSHYFAKMSERQNLGKVASAGHRLSLEVYDALKDIDTQIESLKGALDDTAHLSKQEVTLMLATIASGLRVLQRMSLSANTQWRDALPPEEASEVDRRRKRLIELSDEITLEVTTETRTLK